MQIDYLWVSWFKETNNCSQFCWKTKSAPFPVNNCQLLYNIVPPDLNGVIIKMLYNFSYRVTSLKIKGHHHNSYMLPRLRFSRALTSLSYSYRVSAVGRPEAAEHEYCGVFGQQLPTESPSNLRATQCSMFGWW